MDPPPPSAPAADQVSEPSSSGRTSSIATAFALAGFAFVLAGDLLPYIRVSSFKPFVFELGSRPIPAIVVAFLVPAAALVLILVASAAARFSNPVMRGVASGLLLAVGTIELLQFVDFTTIAFVYPHGGELTFEPWPILGLIGSLLVISAGILGIRTARPDVQPSDSQVSSTI